MTNLEFREAIIDLDWTDREAGLVLSCDPRTIRRWMSGDRAVPEPVAKLIRLIQSGKVTVEDVRDA